MQKNFNILVIGFIVFAMVFISGCIYEQPSQNATNSSNGGNTNIILNDHSGENIGGNGRDSTIAGSNTVTGGNTTPGSNTSGNSTIAGSNIAGDNVGGNTNTGINGNVASDGTVTGNNVGGNTHTSINGNVASDGTVAGNVSGNQNGNAKKLSDYYNINNLSAHTAVYEIKEQNKITDLAIYIKGENTRFSDEKNIYIISAQIYTCNMVDKEWICFKGKMQTNIDSYIRQFKNIDSKDICYKYIGPQKILDINAECFECIKGSITTKICVHSNASVILLIESKSAGSMKSSITAKTIDLTSPPNSVFELPPNSTLMGVPPMPN
ncbi:MAG: hypothetical protein QMD06_00845 [Candidatus Altarchaeum sp.]|nr:hypothetical protein [Candidatus Altarchaeum sp.]